MSRPQKTQQIQVGFKWPVWLVEAVDEEAERAGLNRTDLVKHLITIAMHKRGHSPLKKAA